MFREFHTLGAATGKAREENTLVAGSCCSSKAEADRRFLVGRYSFTTSDIHYASIGRGNNALMSVVSLSRACREWKGVRSKLKIGRKEADNTVTRDSI